MIAISIGRDRGTACPLFHGTKEIGVIDCGDIKESRRYAQMIQMAVLLAVRQDLPIDKHFIE